MIHASLCLHVHLCKDYPQESADIFFQDVAGLNEQQTRQLSELLVNSLSHFHVSKHYSCAVLVVLKSMLCSLLRWKKCTISKENPSCSRF